MARGASPKNRKTRGKATGSGSKRKNTRSSEGLLNEIVLIAVIAFSILLLMSIIGFAGNLGEFISDILYGLFGIISYLVPFAIVIFTVFYLKNKGNPVSAVKIWSGILILLSLCSFAQLLQFPHDTEVTKYTEYFEKCKGLKKGGGIVGGFISSILDKGLGRAGTYIVLSVLVIIALILITERSLLGGVKNGGRTLIDNARNDLNRARARREEERPIREENRRLRQEEQRLKRLEEEEIRKQKVKERDERLRQRDLERLKRRQEEERIREENLRKKKDGSPRIDRKVSGVMLETKLTPAPDRPEINDDIHEVSYDPSSGMEPYPVANNIQDDEIYEIKPESVVNERQVKYDNVRSDHTIYVEADRIIEDEIIDDSIVEEKPVRPVRPAAVVKETRYVPEPAKAPVKKSNARRIVRDFKFPPVNLLKKGSSASRGDSRSMLDSKARQLQETLKEFGVSVTMTGYTQGPAITRFEMKPDVGVKVSKVLGLSDDIMLSMAAKNVRIEAPIPGKSLIGIELPNEENTAVMLRDLIESQEFKRSDSKLSFAVGKGLSGETVVADIGKMPHMLIAGATGSGKSVCINTLIMSILYKARPDEVKLIMIDPKVVELSVYNGIPHLMIPVVTDPKQASEALKWGVAEMDDRYNRFAEFSVRDLNGYNRKVESMTDVPEQDRYKVLPRIVIIVDELADLMMVASKEVEESICRIAQKARAAGIHLVIATQRPSVDVVTGLIKANMPSRIAFSVSSGVDSRTILDMVGAEKLLGKGDMLFYPQGYTKPARVQGAFVSDQEVNSVVDFLKDHSGQEGYDEEIAEKIKTASVSSGSSSDASFGSSSPGNGRDELFAEAARAIIDKNKASIGMLQRLFKIGFNRAARIMDQLAEAGVVGEEEGTKPRKVLMSMEQLEAYIEEYI
ncbi:MAG: DNA translocase FtsK 4TM domain-containing protein [Lachnospiraceae bacterium]|nr:DNA translocase FtsK 4TM domain-containing protein [Lachnospiraceae bacterium]